MSEEYCLIIKNMKKIVWMIVATLGIITSSCSNTDYINAIPQESTAIVSIDIPAVAKNLKLDNNNSANVLKSILHVDDASDCGIDMSKKIYLFESPEGNLGMCAKVDDSGDLKDWLEKLSKQNICKNISERYGYKFTILKDSWVVGFSDKSLIIMGPAVATAQAELQHQISKYLSQDEDEGIKGTPMYDKLDSIQGGVAMVAQAQALPEKFVAPFTLGAPKEADASQVLIAADMKVDKGVLLINGETFSFNKSINESLKNSLKTYRPISGKYTNSMPNNALWGMFVNVDGKNYIKLLQANKGIQAILAGVNTAIDMDNIIRSINGDMTIIVPSYSSDKPNIMMGAKLASHDFLNDVGYWKQSAPKGSRILDWGKNSYYYTDGTTNFYFGVSDDNQFYSGSASDMAVNSIQKAKNPISPNVQSLIKGKRMCMVINISSLSKNTDIIKTFMTLLHPVFGNVNTIVYFL